MKLDKKTMLKLMKEEYNKRLEHYLGEIEIKDTKRDVNLIKSAQGLKVKNEQGLELTIDDLVVINNQEYVVLRMPDDPRAGTSPEDMSMIDGKSNLSPEMTSPQIRETDEDPEESNEEREDSDYAGRDLRRKSSDVNYKRSIKTYDASKDSLSGKKVEDNKVYVLVTDFEKEYSL